MNESKLMQHLLEPRFHEHSDRRTTLLIRNSFLQRRYSGRCLQETPRVRPASICSCLCRRPGGSHPKVWWASRHETMRCLAGDFPQSYIETVCCHCPWHWQTGEVAQSPVPGVLQSPLYLCKSTALQKIIQKRNVTLTQRTQVTCKKYDSYRRKQYYKAKHKFHSNNYIRQQGGVMWSFCLCLILWVGLLKKLWADFIETWCWLDLPIGKTG